MHPYQERVVDERQQLTNKTDKLAVFIRSDAFDDLSIQEQALLLSQLDYMRLYGDVLDQRIQLWSNHG